MVSIRSRDTAIWTASGSTFYTQQLACNKIAAVALVWDIRRKLRWRPLGRRSHRRCVGLCDGRQCSQHCQELIHQSPLTHGGQNIQFCATILTRVDATQVPDDLPDRSGRSQMVGSLVQTLPQFLSALCPQCSHSLTFMTASSMLAACCGCSCPAATTAAAALCSTSMTACASCCAWRKRAPTQLLTPTMPLLHRLQPLSSVMLPRDQNNARRSL